ncbi:RDD family protein [Actinoallomurus sp. NBC_01490]|uniref:RDD family protein n=1 Tax=Actinoallomurus sp. NBC_01490 TaxID=2903557 RepID=UPI002E347CA4|nr:RDD family protein [Actinoallomurus sp. NBC_01490]
MSDPAGVILRRYAQFVLDRLVTTVPAVVVLVLGLRWTLHLPRGDDRMTPAYLTMAGFLLVILAGNWFIEVWVPHRWLGGTPGMRCLGLRVVTERGETPGLRAHLIRWAMVIVDGYFFGLVGALAIAFSPRHQRFGDMVARTLVVRRG